MQTKQMDSAQLRKIQNRVNQQLTKLEQKHSIRILYTGVGLESVEVGIRSSGNVEHVLSEDELTAFKQSLYEMVGIQFPLVVSVRTCCVEKPHITGKITEWHEKTQRILVVDEQELLGRSTLPTATWVQLSFDGLLIVDGTKVPSGFSKELVGRSVQVWSEGIIITSNPGQTTALKIVVH